MIHTPNTPRVLTEPVTEAVSLEELKLQCGIDPSDTTWDTYLSLCRVAARQHYEDETWRTMHETEYVLSLSSTPGSCIRLPKATPLISVTSITITDSDLTPHTVPTSTYLIDTEKIPGLIHLRTGEAWPSYTLSPASPVKIQYKCGIPTGSPQTEVSALDKLCILLVGRALFEHREGWSFSNRESVSNVINPGLERILMSRRVEWAC